MIDFESITNSVAGTVSYATGVLSSTLTSTRVGSDIAYNLSNSKLFLSSVKCLKPIGYGATGISVISDVILTAEGQQSWTEFGVNTTITGTAMYIGGFYGITIQLNYQASKAYMRTIYKHPEWVMPARYHSFTH